MRIKVTQVKFNKVHSLKDKGLSTAATIEGEDGVAIVTGYEGKASGKLSCWLVLTDRDFSSGKIKEVRAVEVDGKKIKEDTFYMLKDGKVIEA